MKKVTVHASKTYNIFIGSNLIDKVCDYLPKHLTSKSAVVVSDDNVFPLYGDKLVSALKCGGHSVTSFVFRHGEKSKSLKTLEKLLEKMCEANISRDAFLVALGGGVVGDLSGFAAATFKRGIEYIQIPTTLLAAVDSSVGGKTAVDLKNGKNQVGCFHQPSAVICDINTLKTLPKKEYICGSAEVIKYAMINDGDLYKNILNLPIKDNYEDVILKCVKIKRDYVENDEFDKGERMMLNFGHTIAHAIESCSNYTISHGMAVAMGMELITKSACKKNYCTQKTYDDLKLLLKKYSLLKPIPYNAQELYCSALTDKKSSGQNISIIIPEKIGKCRILSINKNELITFIE